ncbi:MAG TPA: dihydroneopterin aldolase [Chthoniobacteraceae bacterium]|jgi:dihydroneopterin aldolase|nr:dihydroneopterin aldolase [Chthoniobacteraceae bacterium]
MADEILIEGLALRARIGVTEAERAEPQLLAVNLTIETGREFGSFADEIEHTIDYAVVCQAVKALGMARPRQLIETLGHEIATMIIQQFGASAVEVELRKFVVPDTAFVAVSLRRERGSSERPAEPHVHRELVRRRRRSSSSS